MGTWAGNGEPFWKTQDFAFVLCHINSEGKILTAGGMNNAEESGKSASKCKLFFKF